MTAGQGNGQGNGEGNDQGKDRGNRARALAAELLRAADTRLPTSAVSRLGRTAWAALKTGVAAVRQRASGEGTAGGLGALDAATIEELVGSLGELKGIAMKLGQILSYIDDTLPLETRLLLGVLQVSSQPTAFSIIVETLRAELGPRAEELLARLEREPVASASIGQVHRATLPDGTRVAVKVRHPGIDEAIRADFRAAVVGPALARLVMPGANVREFIAEARERFLAECDYRAEARNQARFGALFSGDERILVPRVHEDWSADRVLTTTWHDGLGLEAFLASDPAQPERDRLGRALYEFYVGTLYRHGLFNADPHPGNLLFVPPGRVVVLDYGCVREFDRQTLSALVALSRAVQDDDARRIRDALGALGARDPEAGPGYEVTRALLRGFFSPVLTPGARPIAAGVSLQAREVFESKRALLRLHLPGKLLFLFRIRFGLYAVLARLGAVLDWQALEDELRAGV